MAWERLPTRGCDLNGARAMRDPQRRRAILGRVLVDTPVRALHRTAALRDLLRLCALLPIIGLLMGCSSGWTDTGRQEPSREPGARARVFYREFPTFAGPRQGEYAFETRSGSRRSERELRRELDGYLAKCAFINQWPRHGDVNGVPAHEAPFDLCLVSIEPTIIVGVERKGPSGSGLVLRDRGARPFVGSAHLAGIIEARIDLPYHARNHYLVLAR